MSKVRWGVIGATGIAERRTMPEGIMSARNSELVAVMDITEEKARSAADKYGGVAWFTNVAEMLQQAEMDACYVASPTHVHPENVKACAAAGLNVLCEKPLARDAAEARPMVEICEEHGVKLGVGFMMRFHHLSGEAKRLVAEGALGQIVSARAQFGMDYPPAPGLFRQMKELHKGGAFMDVGNHATDLVEYILGVRVASVTAVAGNVVYEYEGVEDSCLALYEFDNGALGMVDAYFSTAAAQNVLEINGSKATLIATGILGQTPGGVLRVFEVVDTDMEEKLRIDSDGRNMYQGEIEAFAEAILNDTEPPVSGRDGLWSQELMDAVYQSTETGRKVTVS